MRRKEKASNFELGNLRNAFGFEGLPSENNFVSYKVLSHCNQGLIPRHMPEGEYTDMEKVQGDIF